MYKRGLVDPTRTYYLSEETLLADAPEILSGMDSRAFFNVPTRHECKLHKGLWAARWQSRKEAKSATTVRYREMLDDVQASQMVFDPYRERRQVVANIALYTGCICCMIVFEPYLPDRVLRQFGLVQLVPGSPLALLRGSRGSTSVTYSVVYQYTDALWQNWRDHMLHEDK
ncbi:hypothetical protein RHMOL_Rhmol02G0161400 [Rhododendron molle]|uniref:Uncharacterized protein n=1 Tax=Rhododendron molle TaxID=49168 RepID=A0ACC0PQU2_RHOML|nr:hypothetical protein RHMOL_Rhmol02G0161400 [Rhododendron molle]